MMKKMDIDRVEKAFEKLQLLISSGKFMEAREVRTVIFSLSVDEIHEVTDKLHTLKAAAASEFEADSAEWVGVAHSEAQLGSGSVSPSMVDFYDNEVSAPHSNFTRISSRIDFVIAVAEHFVVGKQ